jgi:hypothetical protein
MTKKRPKKRRAGRPKAEKKHVRLVAYIDPDVRDRIHELARADGFPSVSAWAGWVLATASRSQGFAQTRDDAAFRSGKIPRHVYEAKLPPDPDGLVMKALLEERESGY